MTTLWSCPNPDCPPSDVAPVDVGSDSETADTEVAGEFSTQDLAEFLHVPHATIYKWLAAGVGPAGYRVGRHLRYRQSDVERWAREQGGKALAVCSGDCGAIYPRNAFRQVPES